MQSRRDGYGQSDFDTVVIGGGITGLCITSLLAAEGRAVLCLDDGHAAGSIANAGSLHVQTQSRLTRMFPERAADFMRTLSLYPRAVACWSDLAASLPEDIEFSLGGGIMVADNAQQLADLRHKSLLEKQHGVDTEILDRHEVLEKMPYLNPSIHGGSYCAIEGKINPLRANAAIRRAAVKAGAVIIDAARVMRLERGRKSHVAVSTAGRFRAQRIVIAAGAGCGALAACVGLSLPTTAEPLHMNVTEAVAPFMKHLLQHAERPITVKQLHSGHLLIGGGWPASHAVEPRPPAVRLDSLCGNLALAQELIPGIGDLRILRCWAGINPTADLLSILGEIEGIPGFFVALPGDAGYTLAPYCARLLVEQMSGRVPDFSLQHFSPTRF